MRKCGQPSHVALPHCALRGNVRLNQTAIFRSQPNGMGSGLPFGGTIADHIHNAMSQSAVVYRSAGTGVTCMVPCRTPQWQWSLTKGNQHFGVRAFSPLPDPMPPRAKWGPGLCVSRAHADAAQHGHLCLTASKVGKWGFATRLFTATGPAFRNRVASFEIIIIALYRARKRSLRKW